MTDIPSKIPDTDVVVLIICYFKVIFGLIWIEMIIARYTALYCSDLSVDDYYYSVLYTNADVK